MIFNQKIIFDNWLFKNNHVSIPDYGLYQDRLLYVWEPDSGSVTLSGNNITQFYARNNRGEIIPTSLFTQSVTASAPKFFGSIIPTLKRPSLYQSSSWMTTQFPIDTPDEITVILVLRNEIVDVAFRVPLEKGFPFFTQPTGFTMYNNAQFPWAAYANPTNTQTNKIGGSVIVANSVHLASFTVTGNGANAIPLAKYNATTLNANLTASVATGSMIDQQWNLNRFGGASPWFGHVCSLRIYSGSFSVSQAAAIYTQLSTSFFV